MKYYAQIRKDLQAEGVAIPTSEEGVYLDHGDPMLSIQPDEMEDLEFNCVVLHDGELHLVQSIDLDDATMEVRV